MALKAEAPSLDLVLLFADLALSAGVSLAVLRGVALDHGDAEVLLAFASVSILAFPIAMSAVGLYGSTRRASLPRLLASLVLAGAVTASVLMGLALLTGRTHWLPAVATVAFAQMGVFSVQRLVILGLWRGARERGRNYWDLVVLGTGSRARAFADEVDAHPGWGVRIVAFLDEAGVSVDPRLGGSRTGNLKDFPELLRSVVVDEVIVALPRSLLASVEPVVRESARVGIPITVLSDLFTDLLPVQQGARYGRLSALRFATVRQAPMALVVKRCIDVIGASLLLVASSPLMALAAAAVWSSSPGPVLFRQRRLGLHGRPFELLKFRSMVLDAEKLQVDLAPRNEMDGPTFKIRDDPRITWVGRLLRRWSVDELPQFWNVLRGDMSLVGPRPPLPDEVGHYGLDDRRRLSVRPGITCLWQISGRSELNFARWVELDLHYIDHWSIGLDLWILLRTPLAVIRGNGAS
jgi:exopolysaccharide biosynthesis polyprenyl glycosylphosphotransferase